MFGYNGSSKNIFKTLILISLLNIMMYHFNFNLSDILNPLKASNTRYFGKHQSLQTPLFNKNNNWVLQNNVSGDVVVVQPNTLIMIDEQDARFRFKSYNSEDNVLLVKVGNNLEFKYELSTIKKMKLALNPQATPEKMIGAGAASILGGAIGWGLGVKNMAENSAAPMGGCMMGMPIGWGLFLALSPKKWLEISFSEWSVVE